MQTKLCDVHLHFDTQKIDPIADLLDYRMEQHISKGVLILNSRSEFDLWLQAQKDVAFSDVYVPVFGLNKNDRFIEDLWTINYCKRGPLRIKLHPRLFMMRKEEDGWYFSWIERYNPQIVVVDDFPYGDTVDTYYTANLISALAKTFPKTKIVMAHAGGVELLSHVMRCKVYPNVYYDISLTINYLSASSIRQDLYWLMKFHPHKILLGADYPDFKLHEAIQELSSMDMFDSKMAHVFWENANEVYLLDE